MNIRNNSGPGGSSVDYTLPLPVYFLLALWIMDLAWWSWATGRLYNRPSHSIFALCFTLPTKLSIQHLWITDNTFNFALVDYRQYVQAIS